MRRPLSAVFVPLFLALCIVLPLRSASAQAEPRQISVPEVFGGREAEAGAWPWQVALVLARQPDAYLGQYCGGTLIAPEWVLTAAHCADGFEPQDVEAVLGRHRLSSDEGERIAVAEIMIHPDFNYDPLSFSNDLDADLALMRLAAPSNQQPVSLFQGLAGEEESLYVGGTVTGWGLTDQLIYPDALHEVVVPFVAPEICRQTYGAAVTDNMICAGYPKGNKDSCYGDSGGPLVVHSQEDEEAGGWRQIGIVSWGRYCGTAGAPGVYTRVAGFTAWIEACMDNPAAPVCIGSDLYEPDDEPQLATLVETGSISQTHHFHVESDRDWVKFEAHAGTSYRIDVQPLGFQSDPLAWLYGADGLTPLAYDDDSGEGNGARLIWHAVRDTILYVELQDEVNGKGNETAYSVVIEEVTPIYLPRIAH